jgi:peptidoglycan/xylan/chitin deacetylase (PgdA/CDA1 family)/3D (Asp-Asp-Asp) domain-containing protein
VPRRFLILAAALLAAALPASAAARPISKPRWLTKVAVTEYYPVPEKWFVGARVKAPGIPGKHRVDWLYGGSGLFMEGGGVDLEGRRVHLNVIGKPGWVDKNGKPTTVGDARRPVFWRSYGWRARGGRVTFPLEGGGWYRGLKSRRYTKPRGVKFAPGASLSTLRYWRSIAVDPNVIKKGSRVYVPAYKNKPGGGWMRAVDTGGAVKGRHIDVYRPAPSRQGGATSRRNQRIYVVPPKRTANAASVPGDPIEAVGARLAQHAFKLELHIRLAEPLRRSDLTAAGRLLCVGLGGPASPTQRLCVQRDRLVLVPERGRTRRFRSRIKIGSRHVRVRFRYAVEKIHPGTLRWRVEDADGDAVFPRKGRKALRVVAPYVLGCERRGPSLVRRADGRRKRIALTFDDGPGPATRAVLAILERYDARATFFMLGQEVHRDPAGARAVLAAGQELANHSYSHPMLPSFAQLKGTSSAIQRATGFRPCNFRPPGGVVDGRLVADARHLGMSTIVWDVDPQDWRTPGAGAIKAGVLGAARGGSIVVLHDAGGPRGQTLAALPGILKTLKRRGYKLVTVRDLLGYKSVYGPR